MDKIEKALAKLTAKERETVKQILRQLIARQTTGLHIQKLKGHEEIFRVRKGRLRIIYRQISGNIFLLAVERRSDNTYRNF